MHETADRAQRGAGAGDRRRERRSIGHVEREADRRHSVFLPYFIGDACCVVAVEIPRGDWSARFGQRVHRRGADTRPAAGDDHAGEGRIRNTAGHGPTLALGAGLIRSVGAAVV